MQMLSHLLAPSSPIPNHPRWPLLVYNGAVELSGSDPAAIFEGGDKGEIELTATLRTEGVRRDVAGKTIRMLSSDGGRTWTCRPGTAPVKYLPGACRD